ncbi:MAG: hypothetical protein EHM40_08715 [Chloroflexi bacterium]|nr:MAG: hypothetical protein EHM40_08715 [Chloroflexota bacterium]
MTDWNLMTESIRNAMHIVEKAHTASRQLRDNANPETFDNFRAQLQELTEDLAKIQTVIDNQEAFVREEFADWLGKAFSARPAGYHRTRRMQPGAPS